MEPQDWTNIDVFRLPMDAPDDVSELKNKLESGQIVAENIIGIIAQTEGTGYARGYASLCLQLFARRLSPDISSSGV